MEQAAELGIFGALKKMTEVFSGWLPILVLVSLTAGVWLYFLLVSRHEPQHQSLMVCLRRFLRFEALFWPVLGRILYLSLSLFLLLSGIITTFFVNFFGGLVGTALLLVLVRILFEMSMMLFGIHAKIMKMDTQKKPEEPVIPWKTVPAKIETGRGGKKERGNSQKSAEAEEPLTSKDLPGQDVDVPFFSGKRVDKEEGPVLK